MPRPPTGSHPLGRYEVVKKKKVDTCCDEIATSIVKNYTEKVGTSKRAWRMQVCGFGRLVLQAAGRLAGPRTGREPPEPASGWRCVGASGREHGYLARFHPLHPTCTQCGIVYCLTRNECESVADKLEVGG